MNFTAGSSISFHLIFAFSETVNFDAFHDAAEGSFYNMGDPAVSWPEEAESSGFFDADTEYTASVDLTPDSDYDDDQILYILEEIKKEMADEGIGVILLKIVSGHEDLSVD